MLQPLIICQKKRKEEEFCLLSQDLCLALQEHDKVVLIARYL
jgi:hypothetical protein